MTGQRQPDRSVNRRLRSTVAIAITAVIAGLMLQTPALWAAAGRIGLAPVTHQSVAPSAVASTTPPRPADTPTPSASSGLPSASSGLPGVPTLGHIYLILMEDHDLVDLASAGHAPFIASVLPTAAVAVNYHAVATGSLPNYVALLSGSTYGVNDDGVHYVDAVNLMDQLEKHDRTWAVYAENVPPGCFLGESAPNGPDGTGTYVRRHEPAVSFTDIVSDPKRCARITDLSHFQPGLVDFSMIIPNLCHDMHDCSVAVGDSFLRKLILSITSSSTWTANDAIFLTVDEGENTRDTSLIVMSERAAAGATSNVLHDHYSLLRTIQDSWGLGCLQQSCDAVPLVELFSSATR